MSDKLRDNHFSEDWELFNIQPVYFNANGLKWVLDKIGVILNFVWVSLLKVDDGIQHGPWAFIQPHFVSQPSLSVF
jgi:hypothetical protein